MPKFKRQVYNEPFKLEVLRDHYLSGMSVSFTVRKWNLSCSKVLLRWMDLYPVDSETLSLDLETQFHSKMKDSEKSKEALLSEEILRLKKALEMEKLRSRAFEKLIQISEQQEGIPILKKGGAKP